MSNLKKFNSIFNEEGREEVFFKDHWSLQSIKHRMNSDVGKSNLIMNKKKIIADLDLIFCIQYLGPIKKYTTNIKNPKDIVLPF